MCGYCTDQLWTKKTVKYSTCLLAKLKIYYRTYTLIFNNPYFVPTQFLPILSSNLTDSTLVISRSRRLMLAHLCTTSLTLYILWITMAQVDGQDDKEKTTALKGKMLVDVALLTAFVSIIWSSGVFLLTWKITIILFNQFNLLLQLLTHFQPIYIQIADISTMKLYYFFLSSSVTLVQTGFKPVFSEIKRLPLYPNVIQYCYVYTIYDVILENILVLY